VRLPALPFAALLALLPVASCGDGEGSKAGPPVTVAVGQVLRVTAHEYSFKPAAVVAHGATALQVRLENDGSLAHNLRLRRDGRELGGTPSIAAGGSGSATIRVRPGRYELLCTVGDHAELGMKGELRVKE
jgi:plastocyanin